MKNQAVLKDIFLVLLISLLFYGFQLGSRPLNNPDEGRYASVSYNMIIHKDYVTPKVFEAPFLDKPPVYYWLQAGIFKAFGINNSTIRFWPMVAGVLGIAFVYLSSLLLFNRKTAILASSILATAPVYFFSARYANLDLELAVFVTISLLSFLLGTKFYPSKQGKILYLVAYIFAGIGFLTKGLIAILFPVVIIGIWILIFRKWKVILQMQILPGILIILAIISPWIYFAMQANNNFIDYFFIYQQFSRFLSTEYFNAKMPFWFYFIVVLVGFGAWSALLVGSLKEIKASIKEKKTNFEYLVFLLIWIIFIFIFFSIPKSKLIGYILPIFPAIAIVIGYCYSNVNKASLSIKVAAILQFILLVALIIAQIIISRVNLIWIGSSYYPYMFIPLLLMVIPFILLFKKSDFLTYHYFISIIGIIILITANAYSKYMYVGSSSTKPIYDYVENKLTADSKIVLFGSYLPDIIVYAKRNIYFANNWEKIARSTKNDGDIYRVASYCYSNNNTNKCPLLLSISDFKQLWNNNNNTYVILKKSFLEEFSKIINNYYIAFETPTAVLVKKVRF